MNENHDIEIGMCWPNIALCVCQEMNYVFLEFWVVVLCGFYVGSESLMI